MKKRIIIVTIIFSLFILGCDNESVDTGDKITLDNMNVECGVLPAGTYTAIRFTSQSIAYTTTNNGKIFKTEDGGNIWVQQESAIDMRLNEMFFFDDSNGYIVGGDGVTNEGIILKTIDGGNTWESKNLLSQLFSIYFINNMIGYAAGQKLFKTQNGGETWNEINLGYQEYSSIIFFDESTGLLTATVSQTLERVVLKTMDGGIHWEELNNVNLEHNTIRKIQIQEGITYMVSNSGKIFKTSDKGNSWQTIDSPLFNSSYFINERQAVGVSQWWPNGFFSHGVIYITNDGGQHWEMKDFSPNDFFTINDIDFLNNSVAFAVGQTRGCVINIRLK